MNRIALSALAAASALALAGCGFTPLYGSPEVATRLAAVDVQAPEGRVGALLREHLDDALARNAGAAPAYRMDLTLGEQRYPRGVRVDNVATRYEYVLTANYRLTPASGGAVLKSGQVRVEVTYDSADQPYAAIAAQQDAQDRAAAEAARRIQLDLAVWLSNPPKAKAAS